MKDKEDKKEKKDKKGKREKKEKKGMEATATTVAIAAADTDASKQAVTTATKASATGGADANGGQQATPSESSTRDKKDKKEKKEKKDKKGKKDATDMETTAKTAATTAADTDASNTAAPASATGGADAHGGQQATPADSSASKEDTKKTGHSAVTKRAAEAHETEGKSKAPRLEKFVKRAADKPPDAEKPAKISRTGNDEQSGSEDEESSHAGADSASVRSTSVVPSLGKVERVKTMASFDIMDPNLTTPTSERKTTFDEETPLTGEECKNTRGVGRIKNLSQEEKDKIESMSGPSDMPYDERKRQYSALRRAISRANSPALTAKFALCSDSERFGMLKQFVLNPNVDSIYVEEKFSQWVQDLRSDRYTTVTVFQLEKIYGESAEAQQFIQSLIKGQQGTPHPQAPDCKKGYMYKVLKEILEEKTQASTGSSDLSLGGRVRSATAKNMLTKQLGKALDGFGDGFVDKKTGKINSRKPKKEKTPEQLALQEAKTLQSKLKKAIKDIPECLRQISELDIRNSEELLRALKGHIPMLRSLEEDAAEQVATPVSQVQLEPMHEFVEKHKPFLASVETDIKDAKRRVSLVKGSSKSKRKPLAAEDAAEQSDEVDEASQDEK
ncbi:unnamed protein product [Effrenium voratum]|nr:unnamed protein product [Effrenium voratum]